MADFKASAHAALEDSKQAISSAGKAGANEVNIELSVEGTAAVESGTKIRSYYCTKEFYFSILLGLVTSFGAQLLATNHDIQAGSSHPQRLDEYLQHSVGK
jgi:hypothetical protein